MKRKMILFIVTLLVLVLEILPYGAVCNFANPEGEPYRRTYSYFSLTPYGYANFAPLIVAVLTCVLLILTVIAIVRKKDLRTPILTVSAAACLLSFAPLLLGISYFSLVGAMISVLLIVATGLTFFEKKE